MATTKELNITDTGRTCGGWSAEKGIITKEQLDKIAENETNSEGALNALPTPFARFFVVKEAFRRVNAERVRKSGVERAGQAYRRLVSDCLDIFELLYYSNWHQQNGIQIDVREWVAKKELPVLNQFMPTLGDSVKMYMGDLLNPTKLFFVVYRDACGNEVLLGTSSPFTGFVTPPDLDSKKDNSYAQRLNLRRKPDNGNGMGRYFVDVKMLEERPVDFQIYMATLFDNTPVDFAELQEYCKHLNHNVSQDTLGEIVKTTDNNDLEINGLAIRRSTSINTINFLAPTLIRLPHNLNPKHFVLGGKPFLLPLTDEALSVIDNLNDIKVTFKESHNKSKVTVTLKYKEVSYQHDYDKESVLDLEQRNLSLDMGIFPFHKSIDNQFNKDYHLMLWLKDNNPQKMLVNESVSCDFYEKNDQKYVHIRPSDKSDSQYRVTPTTSRTISEPHNPQTHEGTMHCMVEGTCFDAVNLKLNCNGKSYSGLIIPRWMVQSNNNTAFRYAIDFGTTNTFISRRAKDEENAPQPFATCSPEENRMLVTLYEKDSDPQRSIIDREECHVESTDAFVSEFLPALLDGNRYKAPFRTAMSENRSGKGSELFADTNIAFGYEKRLLTGNNRIRTDVKWDKQEKKFIQQYIVELLHIIKNDVIQNNGNVGKTEIVWFSPISFSPELNRIFDECWTKNCEQILGIPSQQVHHMTESEAPFYYYKSANLIKNFSGNVVVMDIGGGSTDMVVFNDSKATNAISTHFGCDICWSADPYAQFADNRSNGIFTLLNQELDKAKDKNFQALNDIFTRPDNKMTTSQIVNFWISNRDQFDNLDELLRDDRVLPVYLMHYTSLVYYMARWIQQCCIDKEAPRTIVLSGNGSRYVDSYLFADHKEMNRITKMILQEVFGPFEHEVQVLASENRKEATCYGGLLEDSSANTATPDTAFNGLNIQFENMRALKTNLNGVKQTIMESNAELLDIMRKLIAALKKQPNSLWAKASLPDDIGDIKDILDNYFSDLTKDMDEDAPCFEPLFFVPVVSQIYHLTNPKID